MIVGTTDFSIPAQPADWAAMPLSGKVVWLMRHASPRPTWREAHRILAGFAAEHNVAARAALEHAEELMRRKFPD